MAQGAMLALGVFNKSPKKSKKPAKASKKVKPVAFKKGGMSKKKGC